MYHAWCINVEIVLQDKDLWTFAKMYSARKNITELDWLLSEKEEQKERIRGCILTNISEQKLQCYYVASRLLTKSTNIDEKNDQDRK